MSIITNKSGSDAPPSPVGLDFMVGPDPAFDNLLYGVGLGFLWGQFAQLLVVGGDRPSPARVESSIDVQDLAGHEL